MAWGLASFLEAFRRDRRGVSAIEFGFIAPVILTIYMGLAELSEGLTAQRRVSHVSSALGDLVAQSDVVTVASLTQTDQHMKALADIIAPQGRFGLIDDPPGFDISLFKGKAVSIHWESMFTRSSFKTPDMIMQHHLLDDVADLVDDGVIRTTLEQTFGTINAANLKRAHALIESGKSRGKIVLEGW